MEKEKPQRRFESLEDEMLYRMSISGWCNESSGSIVCPTTGYFARISINEQELPEIADAFEQVFAGAKFTQHDQVLGHWLVSDRGGQVQVTMYDSEPEVIHDFRQLNRAYKSWLRGQT